MSSSPSNDGIEDWVIWVAPPPRLTRCSAKIFFTRQHVPYGVVITENHIRRLARLVLHPELGECGTNTNEARRDGAIWSLDLSLVERLQRQDTSEHNRDM
jgi:hypothetical protein